MSQEELRHQLALATANAISSPTLDDSPATRAGEGPRGPVSSAADAAGIADGIVDGASP